MQTDAEASASVRNKLGGTEEGPQGPETAQVQGGSGRLRQGMSHLQRDQNGQRVGRRRHRGRSEENEATSKTQERQTYDLLQENGV